MRRSRKRFDVYLYEDGPNAETEFVGKVDARNPEHALEIAKEVFVPQPPKHLWLDEAEPLFVDEFK